MTFLFLFGGKGNIDATFYKILCESYVRETEVYLDTIELKRSHPKKAITFQKVVDGANFSVSPLTLSKHDENLISPPCGSEIRFRVLYSLGYRPEDGNTILRNINPTAVEETNDHIFLRNVFSRGGKENSISRIKDITESVYISAFLETPISILMKEQIYGPAPAETACWHHYLTKNLDLTDIELPNFKSKFSHSFVNRIPVKRRKQIQEASEKGIYIGRYFITDLNYFVGLTVLYMPGYVQISMYVDKPVHLIKSLWYQRLEHIGREIGIDGPNVYTVSSQFLSDSPIQIHRLSWLLDDSPRSLLKLYTRIFSPRTAEVCINNGRDFETYTHLLGKRETIMSKLQEFGIIKSATPTNRFSFTHDI